MTDRVEPYLDNQR